MLRCQNNNPKMSEKWSNMAPNLVRVGAMLGSKIVLDVSKGEKAKKCIPEAIRKEDQKKYRKTSVWGGPQAGSTEGGVR